MLKQGESGYEEGHLFQLSQNAAERLAERFGTPLLVLSLEQIEKNYRF